jgi:hypothetical protein
MDNRPDIDVLLHGRLVASHGRLLLDDLYLEDELAAALGATRSRFGAPLTHSWDRVWIRLVSHGGSAPEE